MLYHIGRHTVHMYVACPTYSGLYMIHIVCNRLINSMSFKNVSPLRADIGWPMNIGECFFAFTI